MSLLTKALLFSTAVLFILLFPYPATAVRVVSPEVKVNINTDKVARIQGPIRYMSVGPFAMDLIQTAATPGDRIIVIDSIGGDVIAGQRIIKLMSVEQQAGTKMICVVTGNAISMAFNILTHCDVRLAAAKAKFMAHVVAAGQLTCENPRCTPERLRQIATELQDVDEPFRQANAKALGLTVKEYDVYASQEHTWTVDALLKRKYLHGVALISK